MTNAIILARRLTRKGDLSKASRIWSAVSRHRRMWLATRDTERSMMAANAVADFA